MSILVSFERQLQQDQELLLKKIHEKTRDTKNVLIYGAGRMAIPVYMFLKENGINVNAFCVTKLSDNKREECGIPILSVQELTYKNEDVVFVSGVNPVLNNDVVRTLNEHGYDNFILSTKYIRYYGEYQRNFYKNPMMEITVKMGCKVNCKYCPQTTLLKNYYQTGNEASVLTFDAFKTCVDKTPSNILIMFAGFTEPFLNRDCAKMVSYVAETGRKMDMYTTLVGMTSDDWEVIKNIEFEEFVLHLPDKEGYSTIEMTDEYINLLKEIVDAKKPNGQPYVDYACSQGNIPDSIRELIDGKVRVYITLNDRAGNLEDDTLVSKKNIQGEISCEISINPDHNVLLPDGRVVLCSQDFGMKHVMGNLLEQSYEDVVYGDAAKKIHECRKSQNGDVLCRNCVQAYNISG